MDLLTSSSSRFQLPFPSCELLTLRTLNVLGTICHSLPFSSFVAMASSSSNDPAFATSGNPDIPLVVDLTELLKEGRRAYVPEPPNDDEKRVI